MLLSSPTRRVSSCRVSSCRVRSGAGRGFTIIELMVVMAILSLAMGLMIPTLLAFFSNQRLKNVRTHFSSAFGMARLIAITEGSPVRVVFFKEGVRVYHMRNRKFRTGEEFNPSSAPGSKKGISFEVQFADKRNDELISYLDWEEEQPLLNVAGDDDLHAGECNVRGLVAVEFQRDGSIVWIEGGDVPSSVFMRDPADGADIVVRQVRNENALYIDLRATGQVKTKFDLDNRPDEETFE